MSRGWVHSSLNMKYLFLKLNEQVQGKRKILGPSGLGVRNPVEGCNEVLGNSPGPRPADRGGGQARPLASGSPGSPWPQVLLQILDSIFLSPFFREDLWTLSTFCFTEEDVENFDVTNLSQDVLRSIEADSFWCMSKLLDGIQVRGLPWTPGPGARRAYGFLTALPRQPPTQHGASSFWSTHLCLFH